MFKLCALVIIKANIQKKTTNFFNYICVWLGSSFCIEGQILPLSIVPMSVNMVQVLPVVCVNGQYGSICSKGFDDRDAIVLCKQLENVFQLVAVGE